MSPARVVAQFVYGCVALFASGFMAGYCYRRDVSRFLEWWRRGRGARSAE